MYDKIIRARKSAASWIVDALGQPVFLQVGHEEAADETDGPVGLDRELGQQDLGFGLQHLLQDLVLENLPAGEDEAPFEDLLERRRPMDLVVEPSEELEELPRDHGVDELVSPSGEVAVDGGP